MGSVLTKSEIELFQQHIYGFYRKNKREFPWRKTINPYYIFVSEVMLQQTQAPRVVVKYNEFIHAFPDFKALSEASVRDIYVVWQGMGYNRRAKYLKESAVIIAKKYKTKLPRDIVLLDELPGIGYNTACSIAAFAFNIPSVFIETNIRSVFIHELLNSARFYSSNPTESDEKFKSVDSSHSTSYRSNNKLREIEPIDDADILPLIEQTLDHKNPRKWYWALMDYGSYLKKTVVNPSRKSKDYTKQSTFKGSNRELRGKILRLVLKKEYKETELIRELNDERAKQLISTLFKEGFLVKKKNIISIT